MKLRRPLFTFRSALSIGRWAALGIGVLILLVAATLSRRQPPSGLTQWAFVTSVQGITAPCGCTSRPLGGLDLMAASLDDARAQGPLGVIGAGPTFFDPSPQSVELLGHRRATADVMAELFRQFDPEVVFLTPAELKEGQEGDATSPWAKAGLAVAPVREDGLLLSRAVTLGAHRAGLIAVLASASPTYAAASVTQAAAALREDGCEGVIVAYLGEARDARAQLSTLEHVDVVIAASQGALAPPEPLGSAMLLDAGARGEHVGYLTLEQSAAATHSRWQFDDGGESQKRPLVEQRARFAREAEQLPEGPGKQARLTRVRSLDEKLAAIVPPTIDGISLGWRLEPLDVDKRRAAWATETLTRYNDGLCDMAIAETAKRTCVEAPSERERYVGSAACQACHAPAFEAWQQSKHAHAWATLEVAHKTCDVTCVGCHVVGWEKPGGFCHLADHQPYQNVGCENCHGPGAGHVAAPTERAAWGPQFVRDTPEATCRSCHNAEHSDQFDFSVYRPQIVVPGHGLPLAATP